MIKLDSKKDQRGVKLKEYQIDKGELGIYDTRNQINDLTGKQWTFSTRSVKTKLYQDLYPKNWLFKYPGLLPMELIFDLFMTFSKKNNLILDPFALTGNTLFVYKFYKPERRFNYMNIELNLYSKLERFNNFIISRDDIMESIEPKSPVDLIFSQIIINNIVNTKINFKNIMNVANRVLKVYIDASKYLADKKYAIISFSNWIVPNDKKLENKYFDITEEIISQFFDINLVPKGEIIWLQPYKSISGLNETRILILRKEK